MKNKTMPDADTLRKLFVYNEETGIIYYNVHELDSRYETEASSLRDDGYLAVSIKGFRNMPVHRVAWKMVNNEDPDVIHHKDENKRNNRISNLQNMNNQEHMRIHGENNKGKKRTVRDRGDLLREISEEEHKDSLEFFCTMDVLNDTVRDGKYDERDVLFAFDAGYAHAKRLIDNMTKRHIKNIIDGKL